MQRTWVNLNLEKRFKVEGFKGVWTALCTPFKDKGVDQASLKTLVRTQLEGGVHGLVVAGTTGESPTMTDKEIHEAFEIVKSEVSGQVPIVIGTGSNSTNKSISATRAAFEWGADGALVVVPYYNKPPQSGLLEHFKSIALSASDLPIILYDVPARTITRLSPETIYELSEVKNIVSIKDATGDIEHGRRLMDKCGDNLTYLTGDDNTLKLFLEAGGDGVISVVSNIAPKETVEFFETYKQGDVHKARSLWDTLEKTIHALNIETNPIPVKTALSLAGVFEADEFRLPMVSLDGERKQKFSQTLKKLGVIK